MDKQIHGVVFIFNGYEPEKELIQILAKELANRCKAEGNIQSFIFNSEDIAKISLKTTMLTEPFNVNNELNPEEKAVMCIGKRMKPYLGETYRRKTFTLGLFQTLMDAYNSPDKESNKAFLRALTLLSQKNEAISISDSILKKYNLDADKLSIVMRTFSYYLTYVENSI